MSNWAFLSLHSLRAYILPSVAEKSETRSYRYAESENDEYTLHVDGCGVRAVVGVSDVAADKDSPQLQTRGQFGRGLYQRSLLLLLRCNSK